MFLDIKKDRSLWINLDLVAYVRTVLDKDAAGDRVSLVFYDINDKEMARLQGNDKRIKKIFKLINILN